MSQALLAMPDEVPISRLDTQGQLLACNDAYLAMCGYARTELEGKSFGLINHPGMPARVIERMWQTLRSGVPWTGPLMGRDKLGTTFWCNLYVVPLFEGGQLNALGTAYHPLDREQSRRADLLYSRLNAGQGPLSAGERLREQLPAMAWPGCWARGSPPPCSANGLNRLGAWPCWPAWRRPVGRPAPANAPMCSESWPSMNWSTATPCWRR